MKTLTKIAIAAGATVLVVAGLAHAREGMPGWHRGGMMGMHGAAMGPMGGGARMERMFERLDANRDGTVALDEVTARVGGLFAYGDGGKDGFLDKGELEQAMLFGPEDRADRLMKIFDVNRDGKISKDEAEKPFRKVFALFDQNDDAKVTKEELDNSPAMAFAQMHGRHGMGRHGHHGMMQAPGGDTVAPKAP